MSADYKEFFSTVRSILNAENPIGIFEGNDINPDEYDPEVSRILPKLKEAKNSNDVRYILYRAFVDMFNEDLAGTELRYEGAAKKIWAAYSKLKKPPST